MSFQNVPSDILTLIGKVAVTFNNVDSLLTGIIVELTGNDFLKEDSYIPFVKMNFSTKKNLLDFLVSSRDPVEPDSPLDTYKLTLQKTLENTGGKRNKLLHSTWNVDEKRGVYRSRMHFVERKVTVEEVPINREDLESFLVEIEDSRAKLAELTFYCKSLNERPHIGQNSKGSVISALIKAAEQ